jgi:hypothetical protein
MPRNISHKSTSPTFELTFPVTPPRVRPASTQPHPPLPPSPPADFDPVSAAAHCSQMSGYVSFASFIPPPAGEDEDEEHEINATRAPAFWNWWGR